MSILQQFQATLIGVGVAIKTPSADGSSGQFIKTDGSGTLSFTTVSEVGGTLTITPPASTVAQVINLHSSAEDFLYVNSSGGSGGNLVKGSWTGGISIFGTIGAGAQNFRSDAGLEINRAYTGGNGALLSIFDATNPGITGSEAALALGAYTSGGLKRKTASISTKWAVLDDHCVLRLNATYGGGSSDDVAVRIFGRRGVDVFGSSETTGPGLSVFRVNGQITQLVPAATVAYRIDMNVASPEDFLHVNHNGGSGGNLLKGSWTGGISIFGRIGDGAANFRTDAGLEINRAYAAGNGAVISIFDATNPGVTTSNAAIVLGAYSSAGSKLKTASILSRWAVVDSVALLSFNVTNGGSDNIAMRIFGGTGIELFGSSDITGPGASTFKVNGVTVGTGAATFGVTTAVSDGAALILKKSTAGATSQYIDFQTSAGVERGYFGYGSSSDDFYCASLLPGALIFYNGGESARFDASRNFGLGQTSFGTSAFKVFAIGNGTAPGSSPADAFQMYSADQAAGNACPFIRTENGAIVKLFQATGWSAATGTATRTTFDTATVTLPQLAERVKALIDDKLAQGLLGA